MEECERLCDRLTIMANGQIKCMGTIQQLKQQYAQGFSIQIKIRDMPNSEEMLNSVKQGLLELFNPQYCVLRDEHKVSSDELKLTISFVFVMESKF